MKEIIVKKDLVDAGFNIIAERYQSIFQYGNCGAQLLHKGRAVVYVEDTGADETEYLLDKKERESALKAPDIFVDNLIWEWANNAESSALAMYQWFPENIEQDYIEGEPCRVLVVGSFFGYEPVDWAKHDDGEEIVFSSPETAQEWIEEQENGPYYLRHGEAGRPDYYIIS